MGGERETILENKKGETTKLSGTRIHESNGEVHFHDDTNKLKCAVSVGSWWKAWDRLRGEPGKWTYTDTINKSTILVETHIVNSNFDVIINISPITVSKDYEKLNTFSKRK